MYKVFVDNICIEFKKNEKFSTNIEDKFFPILDIQNFNEFIFFIRKKSKSEDIYIESNDPNSTLVLFFSAFTKIEAAGGVVENIKLERYLFIKRNNIWDLPKGKIEKGETPERAALREVKEECGINQLEIINELPVTYHVYFAYEKHWFKKTYWYKMTTEDSEFQPQLEEGITEVEMVSKSRVKAIREVTFPNLHNIIDKAILNS